MATTLKLLGNITHGPVTEGLYTRMHAEAVKQTPLLNVGPRYMTVHNVRWWLKLRLRWFLRDGLLKNDLGYTDIFHWGRNTGFKNHWGRNSELWKDWKLNSGS